ncbi:RDD family protein [Streptomyces sp. NPDC059477]|uniref:RDD family protein n=1 Tax=Streptomyces sp. NPDC059477 TaxID=3346847 RepID=UPI0036B79F2D
MSAPTPAPGDDRPREGYYPDPSIPGYVRYWNGASWVPGTSRPAPADGEPLSPPPGVQPAAPAPAPVSAAPVEETGPHFFDEDPEPAPAAGEHYGSRPEPATAWGADRSRQSGYGGDQDRRVSWGSPQPDADAPRQAADPRVAHGAEPPAAPQPAATAQPPAPGQPPAPAQPDGRSSRADGVATIPPTEGIGEAPDPGTFVFRRPRTSGPGPRSESASGAAPIPDPGTMTFRPVPPRSGPQGLSTPGRNQGQGQGYGHSQGPAQHQAQGQGQAQGQHQVQGQIQAQGSGPGFGAGTAAPDRAGAAQHVTPHAQAQAQAHAQAQAQAQAQAPAQAPAPSVPSQSTPPRRTPEPAPQPTPQSVPPQSGTPSGAPSNAPLTSGPGGGQSSWAQQVHQLAGASGGAGGSGDEPVVPWRPPADDPFQAMARRQTEARPAALGKRLVARLVDTLAVAAVTAVAAVPLGTRALDHINGKIDEAKLSGRTVTVWLLDGTTSVYLAIVLGVLLLFGVLYEALPTAKWGRTLGKRLLGLEVRDIEGHAAPTFGAALRRWLVYSVPGLLCFGLIGVLWCLFDKPWRQCWHDKAARTFVAG